ncbi:MAG: glycerate kinase [Lentimicrobiaceae bacterium]|nr:glycerate kinase [Lentimicrobiaceae bacterium]
MHIVVVPDSFKECLSATKVAKAISEGIRLVVPDAEITSIPFSDGGEGLVEALISATNGKLIKTPSVDALNQPIQSFYGMLGDGKTAVIEMAAASGLELIPPVQRDPLTASTYGTGLLLKAAIEAGYTQIVIGIGGSATNDGGAGMAQALGFKLLDLHGNPIGFGGGLLGELHSIDSSEVQDQLRNVKIIVACDVENPLLGTSGATRVYGPQKGATPEMLETLEKNLTHFSQILQKEFGSNFAEIPGAGAAGGLGAGLMAFCNARIVSGFELVNQLTNLEEQISKASLVFTAEGKIDSQTPYGKTVSGIAQIAKKYQVPVIALAGMVEGGLDLLHENGITAVFAIGDKPMSLKKSISCAAGLLTKATEQIMRTLQFFGRP